MAAVRKLLVAAGPLAAVFVVALPAGNAVAGGSGAPGAVGAVGAPISWAACVPRGEGLQCARIRVPLDWDRPNGRTIKLALIRHLASKPEQRIGTLFMNPGGPGDTGIGNVGGPRGVGRDRGRAL